MRLIIKFGVNIANPYFKLLKQIYKQFCKINMDISSIQARIFLRDLPVISTRIHLLNLAGLHKIGTWDFESEIFTLFRVNEIARKDRIIVRCHFPNEKKLWNSHLRNLRLQFYVVLGRVHANTKARKKARKPIFSKATFV